MEFIESICIMDGEVRHLLWHQQRVEATMHRFFPAHHFSWKLHDCIHIPEIFRQGKIKCRIVYDAHRFDVQYESYVPKVIRTLKQVEAHPPLKYAYKFSDRTALEALLNGRGDADEILICRDGWVTDLSFASIAFRKGGAWYTPALPLLAGTSWKRLVYEGKLIPSPIHQKDILLFDCYKIFNAMLDFESATEQPVTTIL